MESTFIVSHRDKYLFGRIKKMVDYVDIEICLYGFDLRFLRGDDKS